MSKPIRSTRANIIAAGGINGVIPIYDIATKEIFYIRGVVGGYHHTDWHAETKKDWDIVRKITGNNPADRRWLERRVLAQAKNKAWFTGGLFTVPHAGVIYSSAYDAGGHQCLHWDFTISENKNPGSPNQYKRGHEACRAAEKATAPSSASTPTPTPVPTQPAVMIDYEVEVTGTRVNIRSEPSTAKGNASIVGEVKPPMKFFVDRRQEGLDNNVTNPWLRIADGEFKGRWIIDRLTRRVESVFPIPPMKKGFAVQVISSTLEREVLLIIEKLHSLGYVNAYAVFHNGRHMARVGTFSSRSEAEQVRLTLISQGFRNDSFLVEE